MRSEAKRFFFVFVFFFLKGVSGVVHFKFFFFFFSSGGGRAGLKKTHLFKGFSLWFRLFLVVLEFVAVVLPFF